MKNIPLDRFRFAQVLQRTRESPEQSPAEHEKYLYEYLIYPQQILQRNSFKREDMFVYINNLFQRTYSTRMYIGCAELCP